MSRKKPNEDVAKRRDNSLAFEDCYEDVLQNIEFGIIRVYRDHLEMTDWDTLTAVEKLIRTYQAEVKGRQTRSPARTPLPQQAYESARAMCEFRLGREMRRDQDDTFVELFTASVC